MITTDIQYNNRYTNKLMMITAKNNNNEFYYFYAQKQCNYSLPLTGFQIVIIVNVKSSYNYCYNPGLFRNNFKVK